jgi:hypothetical protein
MSYNEPQKGRCNTCHYWKLGKPFSDGVWGVCLLASHMNGKHLAGDGGRGFIAGTLASIKPIDTNLNTRGNFGCIEHRVKS